MIAPAQLEWGQHEAVVRAHRDYGGGHRWLELDLPGEARLPVPGQFAQLLLAAPSPVLLPRPMSVASARRERGLVRLGFLYAPVGAGTRALADLAPGAVLGILGPLGRGYPLADPGTPLLIAGGRGVAPLLFAAEALAARGRRCEFLFGARGRDQLVGADQARDRIAAMGSRLHLATDDGTRGERGTVVELLERLAARFTPPFVIHACGPHGMLKAVAAWGLRHGTPAHLAMESVMACGTGVCRGCPLPRSRAGSAAFDPDTTPSLYGNRDYAMCCTEGPVFEARELDWSRIE